MYIGMGHMMFGAPLPAFLKENHVLQALLQMILSGTVLLINKKFFVNGAKGVLRGGELLSPRHATHCLHYHGFCHVSKSFAS